MKAIYQPRRRPHLELRHRTYLAVLEIPAALRRAIGKARFVQSLETDSVSVAERRAAPIIAGWRKRIADARGDGSGGDDAGFFRRALRNAATEAEREVIKDVAWGAAYDVGLVNAADGQSPTDAPEAAQFYSRATGTPFADLLTEWHATSPVTEKTKDMQAADVKRFAAKFPTVEDVTKPDVKRWIGELMAGGLKAKTVQRILSALRGYWRHLQSVGVAPEGVEPFIGLNVAVTGGRASREERRKPFSPADVAKLRAAAIERDDKELGDVIAMAAYTGARIEEICSLRVEHVHLNGAIPYIAINAGKTDAALRDIPVHDELLPVLRRLVGERPNGFMLPDLPADKYGVRSGAPGKRFNTLARGLGFPETLVFHSIRKCVAAMFKAASVPEFVAAEIIGHRIGSMTYGLYSGDAVPLATKAEAIAKLRYPAA